MLRKQSRRMPQQYTNQTASFNGYKLISGLITMYLGTKLLDLQQFFYTFPMSLQKKNNMLGTSSQVMFKATMIFSTRSPWCISCFWIVSVTSQLFSSITFLSHFCNRTTPLSLDTRSSMIINSSLLKAPSRSRRFPISERKETTKTRTFYND